MNVETNSSKDETDMVISGLFNPAVTLALALIGAISWVRAGLVFIAEMLGAMASAGIVAAMFPGTLAVSTTLHPGTSVARGLCKCREGQIGELNY